MANSLQYNMKTIYTADQLKSVYGEPKNITPVATTQPEQQDGILKSIAKDVVGTLVVKPAARVAEAVGRTGILGEDVKKGWEEIANSGESQNYGGIEVAPVKAFGDGGLKQITGEALHTASYLFPYGKMAGAVGKAAFGASKVTPMALTASKIAGNVASGATGGLAGSVGMAMEQDKSIGDIAKDGVTGLAVGGAIPLVGPALRGTGRLVTKGGEKVSGLAIPTSSREAQILQTYKANNPFLTRVKNVLLGIEKSPQTSAKTATEKTLVGTKSGIGVQAKRASGTLWNDVIAPALDSSDQAVDLDGFFTKIQDDIVRNNPEVSRQKALLNALDSFRDDYAGINSVSLKKLQQLKEGWAEFIPEKAYKGENIAGAANQVRKLMANESRQTIYSQLGNEVKQAYFDYGNLQGLQKFGQVSMTGAKLKGGAGSFTSEIISQAVTPIASIGGQAIYRTGKGIEFIGKIGAKNIGQALGIKAGLKFPGDAAVDDIGARIKGTQEKSLPIKTQTSQTIKKPIKKDNISPKSTTQGLKGKGTIPENSYKQYSTEHIDQIKKTLLSDKTKAVVIDSDTIKKMHPEYQPKNPEALHAESSKLAKQLNKEAIDQDTSGVFKMIGGGSGSGKSEIVLPKIMHKPAVIFDGTLGGFDSAVQKIDYALSKGKTVELHPVYTPVELATLFNKMRSRSVMNTVIKENHYGFRDNIPKLLEKYGDKIKVIPYENKVFGVKGGSKPSITNIKEFVNSHKMSKDEIINSVGLVERLIKDKGVDFTKNMINSIL